MVILRFLGQGSRRSMGGLGRKFVGGAVPGHTAVKILNFKYLDENFSWCLVGLFCRSCSCDHFEWSNVLIGVVKLLLSLLLCSCPKFRGSAEYDFFLGLGSSLSSFKFMLCFLLAGMWCLVSNKKGFTRFLWVFVLLWISKESYPLCWNLDSAVRYSLVLTYKAPCFEFQCSESFVASFFVN